MKYNQEFLKDVDNGLSSFPKKISSKYFYDEKGDAIFQKIMALDDYYLTKAEYEIFDNRKAEILSVLNENNRPFNLIEFGAGDGYKTKVLLQHFIEQKADFNYTPIDISQNVLDWLTESLAQEIPELKVEAKQGDYFKVLNDLAKSDGYRNVILFLGSNIGNFTPDEVHTFLSGVREKISVDDLLLMGIDLKKEPRKILKAYNDDKGVTRDFNLNLLGRVNRELGGDFKPETFWHYPVYNPVNGECISMLISTEEQEVTIKANEKTYHFEKWEPIHTEISRKYSLKQLEQMAKRAGFKIEKNLFDQNDYFVSTMWKAI